MLATEKQARVSRNLTDRPGVSRTFFASVAGAARSVLGTVTSD